MRTRRLTTLFSNAAKAGSFINAMLYIDARELKFEDEPDDWHQAAIDIVALASGGTARPKIVRTRPSPSGSKAMPIGGRSNRA